MVGLWVNSLFSFFWLLLVMLILVLWLFSRCSVIFWLMGWFLMSSICRLVRVWVLVIVGVLVMVLLSSWCSLFGSRGWVYWVCMLKVCVCIVLLFGGFSRVMCSVGWLWCRWVSSFVLVGLGFGSWLFSSS